MECGRNKFTFTGTPTVTCLLEGRGGEKSITIPRDLGEPSRLAI